MTLFELQCALRRRQFYASQVESSLRSVVDQQHSLYSWYLLGWVSGCYFRIAEEIYDTCEHV